MIGWPSRVWSPLGPEARKEDIIACWYDLIVIPIFFLAPEPSALPEPFKQDVLNLVKEAKVELYISSNID